MKRENDTVCGPGGAGMRGLVPAFIFMITLTVGGPSVVWAQGSEEAADWEEARCGYPEEMRRFIEQYPDSEYRVEAEGCLEKARNKQLSLLLAECAVHLEADRLTVGAGGNAFDCYREVLALDSGNREALQGFREIEDRYIGWVRKGLETGNLARAARMLERVRGLNPEREEVSELGQKLEAARAASAREAEAEAERKRKEEEAEREVRRKAEEAEAERKRKEAEAAEAAERERQAGREFRDCAGCPEMVVVPSGEFRMGSPSSESGRYDDEGPRHRVSISQSFAVGVYEVTRGEFSQFISETGYSTGDSCWIWEGDDWDDRSGRTWRSPGFSQSDREPVVCVSWNDAKEYTGWLSTKTGHDYRLLSESEWEYAARAGTTGKYHFGSTITSGQANFDRNNGKTVSVGRYPANEFGLHDVHGNVWEWVEDCWNGSYDGAPTDGRAWISGDCGLRVLRGGSWIIEPRNLRSAYRNWDTDGFRSLSYGFRIARTLTP